MEENTPATNTAQPGKKSSRLAILCILIAGSLWGCLGLFNRNLSALGIAPETVVMLRNLGACVILAILFLIYDRSIFRIRLRHLPLFLAMGLVSILLFTLCYFRSQQVSSLAVAATRAQAPVIIRGAEAVRKSYPGFWEDLARAGIHWEEVRDV